MKEIIFIQHAESEQHLNGMVGGWTDWPLTERGRRQASAIGENLIRRLTPGAEYIMYASDLARTRQTAELAGAPAGLKPILRKEIREIYFGSATSQSRAWMEEHALPQPDDMPTFQYRNLPDAESLEDVYKRVGRFVDELLASEHEHFIVVSHCGALEMIYSYCMHLDLNRIPVQRFAGEAAGVSRITWDDHQNAFLSYLNDTSDWRGI